MAKERHWLVGIARWIVGIMFVLGTPILLALLIVYGWTMINPVALTRLPPGEPVWTVVDDQFGGLVVPDVAGGARRLIARAEQSAGLRLRLRCDVQRAELGSLAEWRTMWSSQREDLIAALTYVCGEPMTLHYRGEVLATVSFENVVERERRERVWISPGAPTWRRANVRRRNDTPRTRRPTPE